jgi:uncharacterized membrane protein
MTIPPTNESHLHDKTRLIALIDGVFAVAMTLLVLDLKVPSQQISVADTLRQMSPALIVYLLAFASIAGYWNIHHNAFKNIAFTDEKLVLISFVGLLFVTLYPVTVSILGAHPLDPLATVILTFNSFMYCISSWATWTYAARHKKLLTEDANIKRLKGIARVMLFAAIGVTLAFPLAFVSVYLAYLVWIIDIPIAIRTARWQKKPAA